MKSRKLPKFASPEALEEFRASLAAPSKSAKAAPPRHVLVCFGGSCLASGAQAVRDALRDALERHGLADGVALVETGCMGPCVIGPVVLIGEDRTFYQGVKAEDAEAIVCSPLAAGFSRRTGRPMATGITSEGCLAVVVYELIDDVTVCVITAFEVDA